MRQQAARAGHLGRVFLMRSATHSTPFFSRSTRVPLTHFSCNATRVASVPDTSCAAPTHGAFCPVAVVVAVKTDLEASADSRKSGEVAGVVDGV